jgi:hypothetical protein
MVSKIHTDFVGTGEERGSGGFDGQLVRSVKCGDGNDEWNDMSG